MFYFLKGFNFLMLEVAFLVVDLTPDPTLLARSFALPTTSGILTFGIFIFGILNIILS